MTLSFRSQLIANIKVALETIDGTGKFENDIAGAGGVQLWAGGGIVLQKVPLAVLYWDTDPASDGPVGYLNRELNVIVDVLTSDAPTGTPPRSSAEVIESLIADVERAVLTDPERGFANTGHNVDTMLVQSAPFPSQEGSPTIGGSVKFRVSYKHVRAEPDNPGVP